MTLRSAAKIFGLSDIMSYDLFGPGDQIQGIMLICLQRQSQKPCLEGKKERAVESSSDDHIALDPAN